MGENAFQVWLRQKKNSLFWHKPLASEKMDSIIVDKDIQKSISTNKTSQVFYAYIESAIVNDYAMLIDLKLRHAFNFLSLGEFEDPSGFERKEKASLRQQKYFNTRNHLEFFLKQDILQHENPDAKLSAFRRWIDIENALLQRHCYEGFLLVNVNLQMLVNRSLIEGLPACSRAMYFEHCKLSAPYKNHVALKLHIVKNKTDLDLYPVIFWYHAIIALNASMDLLTNKKAELQKEKSSIDQIIKLSGDMFSKGDVDKFKSQKRECRKQIRMLSKEIKAQAIKKSKILDDIAAAKKVELKDIPLNQEQTYNQVVHRYNKHEIEVARDVEDSNLKSKESSSSVPKLYSNKLLPSFWTRRGKSADKHWASLFDGSIMERGVSLPKV